MADGMGIPLLDHELSDDELRWVKAVHDDFAAARASFSGRESEFIPKETLRAILGKKEHALTGPMDLSGDGPWRNGRNNHDRLVACVFLKHVELHKHANSRTDQFPMYVTGETDAFSVSDNTPPILKAVTAGDHFHNPPNAPHAFLPKVGKAAGADWEIAFIAITPRNLREDTQMVSEATKAVYKQVVGQEAPADL